MNGCFAPPNLYFRKHQEGLSVRNRSCPTQIHPNLMTSRSYHTATAVVGSMGGKVRIAMWFLPLNFGTLEGPRLQDKIFQGSGV